jgi:hypothetical protein
VGSTVQFFFFPFWLDSHFWVLIGFRVGGSNSAAFLVAFLPPFPTRGWLWFRTRRKALVSFLWDSDMWIRHDHDHDQDPLLIGFLPFLFLLCVYAAGCRRRTAVMYPHSPTLSKSQRPRCGFGQYCRQHRTYITGPRVSALDLAGPCIMSFPSCLSVPCQLTGGTQRRLAEDTYSGRAE